MKISFTFEPGLSEIVKGVLKRKQKRRQLVTIFLLRLKFESYCKVIELTLFM